METVADNEAVKRQLKENTYVDNVKGLVHNEDEATQFKEEAIQIMGKGQFSMAKWESNIQMVDDSVEKGGHHKIPIQRM